MRVEVEMKTIPNVHAKERDQTARVVATISVNFGNSSLMERADSSLTDEQIELIVFHCRIEFFFERGKQAMNLIDEKDVAFLQFCQQGRDVAGFLDSWTSGRSQLGAHFVGDDVGERGLAQAGRAGQQHVIESFAAAARGLHIHAQVLFDLTLPDVFVDACRAQREIELAILVAGETIFHSR